MLTITLCGSLTRARDDLSRVHRALALAGHLVHAPVAALPGEPAPTREQLHRLAVRHRAAIRQSDLVVIVATDGYLGPSTRAEMDHAEQQQIPTQLVVDVNAYLAELAGDIDTIPLPGLDVA